MKRYICAILIPALLLQLFGCYSYRNITLHELKNYEGTNDIKVTKESDYFIIMNRDSTKAYITDWEINDSSIIVEKKSLTGFKDAQNPEEEKTEIKFNQIKSVAVDEFDTGNTVFLIVIIVAIPTMIALAIYESFSGSMFQE